jgi:Family of unknown function (DUF6065)
MPRFTPFSTENVNPATPSKLVLSKDDAEDQYIHAYEVRPTEMKIIPAIADRQWMNETTDGFANRCLPLRIANQMGWLLLNDHPVEVIWNGGSKTSDLTVQSTGINSRPPNILSHFGHGILTWSLPYLFRTSPGYNLYVRGPSNTIKDGTTALDAVVETDWTAATFTMNWKITKPGLPIRFHLDEPICMFFPVRRHQLNNFSSGIYRIADDKSLEEQFLAWKGERSSFLERKQKDQNLRKNWQKDYFKGRSVMGVHFPEHETRLNLTKFPDLRMKDACLKPQKAEDNP